MINIVLYKHSKDFYQLDYSYFDNVEKVVFVTPSPFHADTLRAKLSLHPGKTEFDVITMSKFLKDDLTLLVDADVLEKFKGKAELILYLSTAWKAVSGEQNVGLFKKAFNLLTDLRSFSLSDQVMEAALEDFDPAISKAVMAFQKVLELENIIDEHLANFLLSERLRKGDLPVNYESNKTLVFWGFDFLSAVQVDLIKAIGIRNQVFVPMVKEVFDKAQSTDWVKWLLEQDTNFIELENSEFEFKANIKEYPANYLSRVLSKELENNESSDIYLATKNINISSIQEVNLSNHYFKVSTNFFNDSLTNFFEQLKIFLELNELKVSFENLNKWVDEKVKEFVALKDFRILKIYLLFKKTLCDWANLSELNSEFSLFDLYIFKEVIMLDLPRVSLMPYSLKNYGKIASIKELIAFNPSVQNILCINSNYGPIKGSGQNYTEKVEKYLTSIGPVRRTEFEFEMLKHRIYEVLELESTTVLIENGLMEHDVGWSTILKSLRNQVTSAEISPIHSIKKEYINPINLETNNFSATRIQNYLDCPRKYYLNYIAKLNPLVQVPGVLDVLKLGELEHAVIETYLKSFSDFNEKFFIETIDKCLKQLIEKYNLSIKKDLAQTYLIEIRSLCGPVIKSFLEINKSFGLNLNFEHRINYNHPVYYTGSIDLFAFNEKVQFILDFKRGSGSIPSQKGLLDFEKIQLWFYLQRLKDMGELDIDKEIVFGYVNLSRPEESLIFCSHEITKSLLKQTALEMFKKVNVLKMDLSEKVREYKGLELDTINLIKNEREFIPMPRKPKVCDFCSINNICARGRIDE